MKTYNCPCCNKKYLKQGMKNHIINCAKAEGFIYLNNIFNHVKNKPYQFSLIALLRQTKHFSFYRKHLKQDNKKFIL